MSYRDTRYVEPVAELLSGARAPLGVVAILGNHDDDRVVPAALARRGIRVLRDEWMPLAQGGASLSLAGVRFWTKKQDQVAEAIAGAPPPVRNALRFFSARSRNGRWIRNRMIAPSRNM